MIEDNSGRKPKRGKAHSEEWAFLFIGAPNKRSLLVGVIIIPAIT